MTTQSAPRRARELARAQLIGEITDTARAHLAELGAAGLSLRAVSRDLGMASSALYRYFPSRDALLTALIIDAYNALGQACEQAEATVERSDLLGRWRSIANGARKWALHHPHEYALIYGSPVPGYAAPTDTVDPATRVSVLLLGLLVDVERWGAPMPPSSIEVADGLGRQLQALLEQTGHQVDPHRLIRGISAWVLLFGMLNFELFGQFATIFDDADELFAHQVDLMAAQLGIG